MNSIGFGVIGLGRIGGFHAKSLEHAISGAHLVAAAVDADHRRALLESGAPLPARTRCHVAACPERRRSGRRGIAGCRPPRAHCTDRHHREANLL